MAKPLLPKYFVSRADGVVRPLAEMLPPAHVLDAFFVGGPHLVEREWIVATDAVGNLMAMPDENRAALPETLQAELAFHEMIGMQRKRLLEVAEFFLFYVQFLEQPVQAPGLNDPVYLYGTLFGPYPTSAGQPPAGRQGQLTVTRADLLEALAQGAQYAFRYVGTSGAEQASPRCFHFLLPADREEELERGRGFVLAYPLLPPELIINDVSNEVTVRQLAYDVLSALRDDLRSAGVRHPLCDTTLPVPSRYLLEQELQSKGYEINGDTARKKQTADEGFQGWLASAFGTLMSERLELPPEASTDEFVMLAARTLDTFAGWPSPRATALRNRVRLAPPEAYRHARQQPHTPIQIKIPATTAPSPPKPPIPTYPERLPTWIQDFIATHRQPSQSAPSLTSTATTSATQEPKTKPDWMEDFATHSTHDPQTPDKPAAKAKPDWMKDFE